MRLMRRRGLPPPLAATALAAAMLLLLLCLTSPYGLPWFGTDTSSSGAPVPPRDAAGIPLPSFAYWISGTGGESRRMLRLLKTVHHPRNRYLLHLDAGAPPEERGALAAAVRADATFANVDVIGASYAVDQTGSSALAAVLLRVGAGWDWFVTTGAGKGWDDGVRVVTTGAGKG